MTEQPPPVQPATSEPVPGRSTGRIAIVAVVLAAVIAAAGGAFAYMRLSGGGTQPHDVLPA